MNKPKISVILPVYNVEPYIEECLDSILNQTMIDDLEVIMIDDGSSDNSRYTVERYALDYDNFYAYHKKNEGSGIARNYGLDLAKGDYIHFCDPDDYMLPDFYEKVYEFAKSSPKTDFVSVNCLRFGNFHIWEGILYKKTFENIESPIESTNIKENVNLVWDTGVWNKLIKKEFLNEKNIRFPNENIVSQDLVFTIKLHCLANKIAINPDIYYYWRFRQSKNSVTQQKGKIKSFDDRLRVIELITEFFKEERVEKEIVNSEYNKWLKHDLKEYIKRIKEYPEEYCVENLHKIKNILKDIPEYIKGNLNSYNQIIYKMIENDDYEGLLSFSYLENDLMKNPKLFEISGEEYKEFIDLKRDCEKEEVQAIREKLDSNDEEILIEFSSYLPYAGEEDFTISATIVDDENKEYPIIYEDIVDAIEADADEIINKDISEGEVGLTQHKKRLKIPLDLIKKLNRSRIKIKYEAVNLSKETFLKNNRRKTFIYDDFDVDICVGVLKELFILFREKNNNKVRINDIIKNNSKFILIGSCQEKIDNLIIKNIVKFNEKTFPIQYLSADEIINEYYPNLNDAESDEEKLNKDIEEYEHKFIVELPIKELLNDTIKKWEVGTDKIIDNIRLSKNFYYYSSIYQIPIRNLRNKFSIEYSLIDNVAELQIIKEDDIERYKKNKELKKEIKELKKENRALNKETKKLKKKKEELNKSNEKLLKKNERQKELINDYKNRKIIKIIDKLKHPIK